MYEWCLLEQRNSVTIRHNMIGFSGEGTIWETRDQKSALFKRELAVHQEHHEVHLLHVQFSSVAQLCPTLCNPMECSMPGLPVHHQLLEFAQTHIQWVSDTIQTSHPLVIPFSSCLQTFSASESFPRSQFFTSGGQSTGASALASVLPVNTQDLLPLGLTGLIS